MKKLVVILIIGICLFTGYQYNKVESVPPLYDTPYVAVYGRDSCGFTQKTISELEKAGISYKYFNVDDKDIADSLHKRMESKGIDTRRYLLPVVDVNNHIEIRPNNSEQVDEARSVFLEKETVSLTPPVYGLVSPSNSVPYYGIYHGMRISYGKVF